MITAKDYDRHILSKDLQFQIDEYYQPNNVFAKRRNAIVMEALAPKPGEKILDVGCGVGTFAFHCAKAGARSFGIDYSLESIRVANELCAKFAVNDKASFFLGSAMRLPFQNNSFDKIVAADFIEHITAQEKEALLKEAHRVIKPDGFIVIFTPNGIREKIGDFYWRIRNKLFKDKIPTTELHYGLISSSKFKKMCRKSNFILKLSYRDVTRPYLAKLPLLRRILALNLLFILQKT
jgi:ubiquinone/menaquinone biosynthesis C-methylase UbiE